VQEIIEKILNGKWFSGENAPFKAKFTLENPHLTIITGPNASGKSVLRKILNSAAYDNNILYINTSQSDRSNSSGLKRVAMYGSELDDSTGYNSVKCLLGAFRTTNNSEKNNIVMLDEPEIGCSEEVQAAMGKRIADEMSNLETKSKLLCCFVITHSRELVKSLMHLKPSHWRLSNDGLTLSEYTNREVIPANLEELIEQGHKTWSLVEKTMKKGKK